MQTQWHEFSKLAFSTTYPQLKGYPEGTEVSKLTDGDSYLSELEEKMIIEEYIKKDHWPPMAPTCISLTLTSSFRH